MFSFSNIKYYVLSLWLLIGLSFTFGYDAQVKFSSQHQVTLVELHTNTKASGVSYIPLVQQVNNSGYVPFFTAFSFKGLVHIQNSNARRRLDIQETYTHIIAHTHIIDHLQERSTLSDDTDISQSPVTLF